MSESNVSNAQIVEELREHADAFEGSKFGLLLHRAADRIALMERELAEIKENAPEMMAAEYLKARHRMCYSFCGSEVNKYSCDGCPLGDEANPWTCGYYEGQQPERAVEIVKEWKDTRYVH